MPVEFVNSIWEKGKFSLGKTEICAAGKGEIAMIVLSHPMYVQFLICSNIFNLHV